MGPSVGLYQPWASALREPRADRVIMESTYGDRRHRDRAASLQEMGDVFRTAWEEGGNVLIPAFAVGRSQEILYHLGNHYEDWGIDRWQVFLDSPLDAALEPGGRLRVRPPRRAA